MVDFNQQQSDYEEVTIAKTPTTSQDSEVKSTSGIALECIASGWFRFFGYIIDMTCCYALMYCAGYILGYLSYYYFIELPRENDIFYNILGCLVIFVFYLFFEAIFKMTPGKMILGMKVVDYDGNNPSFKAIFIRSLCRFIPFDAISYVAGEGCWHSSISETYVVSRSDLKTEKAACEINSIR